MLGFENINRHKILAQSVLCKNKPLVGVGTQETI